MNITAEQARLYADGWKQAKETIQEIEKTIESMAKEGEGKCTVSVDARLPYNAVAIITEELEKAGFEVKYERYEKLSQAIFIIKWLFKPEDYDNG